jgi:hypothetical protein
MLKFNTLKAYLVVPFLSILTVFVLPIRLYWSAELRAFYLYTEVATLEGANHLLVRGRDGNIEIVSIDDMTSEVQALVPDL